MADAVKHAPDQLYTYADYCSWAEDERWEIIDGVAFDMSSAPARSHSLASMALLKQFLTFFDGHPCEVHAAPFDVRLPAADEDDDAVTTVVQPDILIVCDRRKLDDKGCRGAPDIIVEILSPTTASRDCIQKRALYEKHGVREFWLVDTANRIVTVYHLDNEGRYGAPSIFADNHVIEMAQFPGLHVDLAKVFPPRPRVVKESPGREL